MKAKFDNPWLVPVLFVVAPVYGAAFGWIFGPLVYPGPRVLPDTDAYTYGFHSNIIGAGIGLAFGLVLAAGIIYQLSRQSTIAIPDETLGHSDDEMADHGHGVEVHGEETPSAPEA